MAISDVPKEVMDKFMSDDEPCRCPEEKPAGKRSATLCYPAHKCDLDEGHAGKHECNCGWTWGRATAKAEAP